MIVKNKIKSLYLYDNVVKKLLTDSEEGREYLARVISAALNKPLKPIAFELSVVHPNIGVNKNIVNGEADLILEGEHFFVNIEINNFKSKALLQKNFSYMCHLVLRQMKNSKDYDKDIKQIYQININNFGILNNGKFIVISKMMDIESHQVTRENLVTIDIDVAKIMKMDYTDIKEKGKASLEYLLCLLVCEDEDALRKLYKGDELMEAMVDKAIQLTCSFDNSLNYDAQKLREHCIFEEGERNNKMETVKKMLKKKFNIGVISEITGLSKEEISELKKTKL